MIRKGRAIVTDRGVTVTMAPAGDVIALDLWGDDDARDLCGAVSLLRVEPHRWWLFDAGTHDLAAMIGERGAWAPIGGGLVRATLAGPGWRGLLMVAGLFDAEDPGFAVGAVAATVIHHVPVRIAVASEAACDVYCAASYAPALAALWREVIGRDNVSLSPHLPTETIGSA